MAFLVVQCSLKCVLILLNWTGGSDADAQYQLIAVHVVLILLNWTGGSDWSFAFHMVSISGLNPS